MPLDERLVAGWLAARSVARALPVPVADHGGWRVDTGSADETCRYVFAAPTEGLRQLGERISDPRTFLKLCDSEEALRAALPRRWRLEAGTSVMTVPCGRIPELRLPDGYTHTIADDGRRLTARIFCDTGDLAASGFAAEVGGVFAYDRIVTDPAHRRVGLGRAVMAMLGGARRSTHSRQVLVATEAGRALYETFGWRVVAPYTTAMLCD